MSLRSIESRACRHLLDPLVERATANARELPKAGGELGEKWLQLPLLPSLLPSGSLLGPLHL